MREGGQKEETRNTGTPVLAEAGLGAGYGGTFEAAGDAGGAGGSGRIRDRRSLDVDGGARTVYADVSGVALRGNVRGGLGWEDWRFAENRIAGMVERSGARGGLDGGRLEGNPPTPRPPTLKRKTGCRRTPSFLGGRPPQ